MWNINNSAPVYIMPFSATSLLIYHALKRKGVEIAGIIDNDINKTGYIYEETTIYSPNEVFSINPKAQVVLCIMKHYTEMENQLRTIGFIRIIYSDKIEYEDTPENMIHLIDRDAFVSLFADGISRYDDLKKTVQYLSWQTYFERMNNVQPYIFNEICNVNINGLQKVKFLLCINATNICCIDNYLQCLESISSQVYKSFNILIIVSYDDYQRIKDYNVTEKYLKADKLYCEENLSNYDIVRYIKEQYLSVDKYDYLVTIGSNDSLAKSALAEVARTINVESATILSANEDRIYKNEYIAPYYKNDYIGDKYLSNVQLLRNFIIVKSDCVSSLYSDFLRDELFIIPFVLYHYRVLENQQHDNEIKSIAFYLPQFHTIPENDLWWGKGFTEWTNVKRAYPMFPGHYQPHEPGALGYYDLVNDENIQREQIKIAREHGLYGFCYYYYWFNGKRLLEKPLDRLIKDKSLDFPFCICWANENWTRRWDGADNEILVEQLYSDTSDEKFILDVIPLLKDDRYVRINNAPILLVYRPDAFPDFKKTISVWREICSAHGITELHVSCVQAFGFINSENVGADSAIEFPPHNSGGRILLNSTINGLLSEYSGKIFDYSYYASSKMHNKKCGYKCFKGVMLGWDNTARMQNNSTIYHGSTPEEYKKWLIATVDFISRYPEDERLLFINAWNEWAEGTHLEPDIKYGNAFLQVTMEAISINT